MPNRPLSCRPRSGFASNLVRTLALLAASGPVLAQPGMVEVTARASDGQVAPGAWVVLAVTLDHQPGWHTHTHDPRIPDSWAGFYAIPTTIEIKGPAGLVRGPTQWPGEHTVHIDLMGTGTAEPYAVYDESATVFLPVRLPADASGEWHIAVEAGFQACNDQSCMPPETAAREILLHADPAGVAEPTLTGLFNAFDPGLLKPDSAGGGAISGDPVPAQTQAPIGPAVESAGDGRTVGLGWWRMLVLILSGAVGGLVLNLTPCVLPVIPIKVMTLVKHGGEHRSRTLVLGLWMALGVVAFWVAVGLPMAFVNSALDPSRLIFGNWWVTLGLGLLIALLGIGIMGLFAIDLPRSVYAVNPRADTAHGSFLFGVMTAVLGLPCFGFVAGAVLAGAATMPPSQIMAVFGGLGVGMAAPYLVLAAFPGLVDRIPRTGPASELVKQVMGLLMLAAAAFFVAVGLYTLIAERPWMAANMKWWSAVLFVAAAGLWLTLRTFQISRRAGPRVVFAALSIAGALGAAWFAADSTGRSKADHLLLARAQGASGYVQGVWNRYTPARFDQAIADGKVVMIDFTAEWCINCKAYKRVVLDRDPVLPWLARSELVAFEGDITSSADPANDLMQQLGITGVPQLVVWGPGIDQPLVSTNATGAEVVRRLELAAGDALAAGR